MVNNKLEQDLVDRFIEAVRSNICEELRLFGEPCNDRCGSQNFADIEYKSVSGCTWAIEAKTGQGSNRQNQVYQLFGNLLAATKRNRDKIGLLLSAEGERYIQNRIKEEFIQDTFIAFGRMVPVHSVFILDGCGNLDRLTWEEWWDHTE